jgi:excisionase family DNA binding protein
LQKAVVKSKGETGMSTREKVSIHADFVLAEPQRNEQGDLNPQFMSVSDAQALTGISKWTWRSWAYAGKVASVKLGKRLLIPASEIERLVSQGTRPSLPAER